MDSVLAVFGVFFFFVSVVSKGNDAPQITKPAFLKELEQLLTHDVPKIVTVPLHKMTAETHACVVHIVRSIDQQFKHLGMNSAFQLLNCLPACFLHFEIDLCAILRSKSVFVACCIPKPDFLALVAEGTRRASKETGGTMPAIKPTFS